MTNASKVLSKDGLFSYNGYAVNWWYTYFLKDFKVMGLDASFIEAGIKSQQKAQRESEEMLNKYFSKVEKVELTNSWHYGNSEDIIEKMLENFEENKKYILDNKKKIKDYYDAKIKKDGEIVCNRISVFWNCYK